MNEALKGRNPQEEAEVQAQGLLWLTLGMSMARLTRTPVDDRAAALLLDWWLTRWPEIADTIWGPRP